MARSAKSRSDATLIWTDPTFDHIDASILSTVAYADVFDYPLTVSQIHRYLIGMAVSKDSVVQTLAENDKVTHTLTHQDGYYTLPGRGSIVDLRIRRANVSAQLWPRALRYGRTIAALPFVRMVALTGSLTMDNAESNDDFDYLIVTEPGRLWLARALVIGLVVKTAARQGDEICPNYLLSERALEFKEHNLYTAHELTQMIPLSGPHLYKKMRHLNPWTARFLPNAKGPPRRVDPSGDARHPARALAETTLRTALGARLEQWEQDRKIRRFTQQNGGKTTVAFSADRCKGHFQSHDAVVLEAFAGRLQELGEILC